MQWHSRTVAFKYSGKVRAGVVHLYAMKLVLWDWNGTLLNDAPILWGIFNELMRDYGYGTISFERYQEIYRHPVREMYEDVGFDLSRHSFDEVALKWHDLYRGRMASVSLHDDVVPALTFLSQRGSRQAVLSALPQGLLQDVVRAHGVASFFEEVRGLSDHHAVGKVDVGRVLVERLGIDGAEVTVIGDSSHDAEVAQAIGAKCLLVARGAESRRRLKAHGVPVLDSFADIVEGIY